MFLTFLIGKLDDDIVCSIYKCRTKFRFHWNTPNLKLLWKIMTYLIWIKIQFIYTEFMMSYGDYKRPVCRLEFFLIITRWSKAASCSVERKKWIVFEPIGTDKLWLFAQAVEITEDYSCMSWTLAYRQLIPIAHLTFSRCKSIQNFNWMDSHNSWFAHTAHFLDYA